MRDFRFANACRDRITRVSHEISVGAHFRFRLSSHGEITIRGSFVGGRFTGDLFAPAAGLARGTVRFRSSRCDSGAVRFSAAN
jgi:hypothetical protein